MYTSLAAVITICAISLCNSQETKKLCHPYDETCSFISANRGYKEVISGIPPLGIDVADPLVLEFVDGSFPDFHYVWYNTTVHGFRSCEVQNVNIDFEIHRMYYELACPRIHMYGLYEANGYLFKMPVLGCGLGNIVMHELLIKVEGILNLINETNGQPHMHVAKYYTQYIPRGAVLLEFENLSSTSGSDLRVAINRQSKSHARCNHDTNNGQYKQIFPSNSS